VPLPFFQVFTSFLLVAAAQPGHSSPFPGRQRPTRIIVMFPGGSAHE
jgi:hypothetical protein